MDQSNERDQHDATSAIPIVEGFTGPQLPVAADQTEIPAGSAALIVVKGPQVGDVFVLHPTTNSIGRNEDNELMLDDVTVSRNHATIEKVDQAWVLRDLNSLNGTYVNRSRIDEIKLTGGEELQIGKYRFAFLLPNIETQ